MWLIVGLGNPGSKYLLNRHNIGFMCIDVLAGDHHFSNKFNSLYAQIATNDRKVILCKPQTYMNISGQSVLAIMQFFKVPLDHVCVIHDDIDLELGVVKVKQGGGSAGHNGLKDIDGRIGKDYHRVRLGVGRPEHKDDVSNYVLSNFPKEEHDTVQEMVCSAVKIIHEMVR